MDEMDRRVILSKVALGEVSPDTLIRNGMLFNAITGEFIKNQSIWIREGRIAYVGPDGHPSLEEQTLVIDAEGMVLLPGLIEGHTHIMSNRYAMEEFIRHVLPTGVTTVITETIEMAILVGQDGIEYLVKGLEQQPIRFYYTLAPLCGLTPSEEIYAPTNEEMAAFLKDPKCLGVGEVYWSNLFLEGRQSERVRELFSIALEMGKVIEGHSAGASGKKLQAYTDLGISSCHEPITVEEVLERLRLGYWVMIREGGVRKELQGVAGIFKKRIDFRRLVLSTDSVDPEGFLSEGGLDASLKSALKLGVPPELAYQMVTINVAEHFHLEHLIGSLSPGRMADILIIPSPDEFSPQLVMCNGKTIFRDGRPLAEPQKVFFPVHLYDTVIMDDYILPPPPTEGKIRVMELISRLVTKEGIVDLGDPEEMRDIQMVIALDRRGSGKRFRGFLKGFGLQRGAYGTTMCWDAPDMIVVGCDGQSIQTVIGRLKENRGGGVYAIGNEVVAEFPAPLCGMMSTKPMAMIGSEIKKLETFLRENGVRWEKPLLTVDTLTTAAIPHLRITSNGYVRLKDRAILPVET